MIDLIIKIIIWILAIILGFNFFCVFTMLCNEAIMKIDDKLDNWERKLKEQKNKE